jgi:hypothetical protein
MLADPRWFSVAALLCSSGLAQKVFEYNIPPEEALALSQIVEDDPDDDVSIYKDWESPEYSLIYRVPMPIPPQKQPKLYVTPHLIRHFPYPLLSLATQILSFSL